MPGKTRVTRHQLMKPTTNREKREALRTKCTRTSLASPSPASDAMPNTMAMTSRSSIQKWPGWGPRLWWWYFIAILAIDWAFPGCFSKRPWGIWESIGGPGSPSMNGPWDSHGLLWYLLANGDLLRPHASAHLRTILAVASSRTSSFGNIAPWPDFWRSSSRITFCCLAKIMVWLLDVAGVQFFGWFFTFYYSRTERNNHTPLTFMVWSVMPRSSCRFVFDGDNPVVWLERSRILKIYHEYPQVKRRIKWHGAPNLPVISIYFKWTFLFWKV